MKVDGQKYYGEGKSKKIARVEAASTALRSFIQFKDGATLSPLKMSSALDFTSDEHTDGTYSANAKMSFFQLSFEILQMN